MVFRPQTGFPEDALRGERMIDFGIPSKPLRMGGRVRLDIPSRHNREIFEDFQRRNAFYHKPWVYHSDDPAYYDQYLMRIKRGITQGCFIFDHQREQLVGVVNINNIMLGPIRAASLGYYADEAYAGRGYMREGMALALDYAVKDIGLHRIEANIQPGNEPSRRLVQKLGFRNEGFSPKYLQIGGKWCDHERWAILDEEIIAISQERK